MTAEEAIFSELERNPLIPAYTISMNKVLAADILSALAAAGLVVMSAEFVRRVATYVVTNHPMQYPMHRIGIICDIAQMDIPGASQRT